MFQTEVKKSLIISRNIKKVSEFGGDKEKGRLSRDEARVMYRIGSDMVFQARLRGLHPNLRVMRSFIEKM